MWKSGNWAVRTLVVWAVIMLVLGIVGLLGQPMLNIFFLAYIITGLPAIGLFFFMRWDYKE